MALEKLNEARFFLQKMKEEGGGKEVQYYYSALMSTSRSFFDYIEPDEDSDFTETIRCEHRQARPASSLMSVFNYPKALGNSNIKCL